MLWWIVESVIHGIKRLLQRLGVLSSDQDVSNHTHVIVKAAHGKTIGLDILEGWTVKDMKLELSSRLDIPPDNLRIIFAGRELNDDLCVDSCDLGNQSVLHAVTVEAKSNHSPANATMPHADGVRRLAMFYCWCGHDDKLCPAKLRVKCSDCDEAAVILSRDPGGWEDVLIPSRIQGHCETCQKETWALFYFRCGNISHRADTDGHNTAALDLVKVNETKLPCVACTDSLQLVLVFPVCGHVLCTDCWSDYARSRLDERQFTVHPDLGYTLQCPLQCDDSHVTSPQHYQMMSAHHYNRYLRFGAEDLVLASGGLLCPQPGCGAGILPDTDHDPSCQRQTCAECGYVFCTSCGQGAHMGACLPCADMGQESGHTDTMSSLVSGVGQWTGADPSSITIRTSTKPCPACR